MRKKTILSLGLIFAFLMQTLLVTEALAVPPAPRAQWTFMIYVCGDNDLHWCWNEFWYPPEYDGPDFVPSLARLESVGSTDLVNFVALVDLVEPEGCELIHIEKGGYTVVETYPELNLGDPQVCIDFVKTVKELYPAKKYLLDFWDHGYGWDYFCYDEGANDWIDLPEFRQIMEAVGYINIVGFDACYMGQAEVAYELVGHAEYMVASEEYVEWEGWPYDTNAKDLVDNPYWAPGRYAVEIVINYGEFYESLSERYPHLAEYYDWQTFSAINIGLMPLLRKVFTNWTSAMLANIDRYRKQYKKALVNAQRMSDTSYYVDMYDYMVQLELLDNIKLKIATDTVKIVLKMTVVANWAGELVPNCNGLSFYWARNKRTWNEFDWDYCMTRRERYIQESTWGQDTGWPDFLDAYCV